MRIHLTLYLAGSGTVRSLAAKRRLDGLVERLDAEVYVDVVDVLEDPARAERDSVFATPTLVRDLPPPGTRVIGDLAEGARVAVALGLDSILLPDAEVAES